MTHASPAFPADRRALRGHHVLGALLGFFGVVFAVNGYFLYSALATHTGVVAVEPYRKGLAYNERIAADERQSKLGWVTDVKASLDGGFTVSVRDASGQPVVRQRVGATIGRPSTDRFDRRLVLQESEPGDYVAAMQPLPPGGWIAQIEIRPSEGAETVYRLRRRLWLMP